MKITVAATRPETIEFSTPEITGEQHLQNHLAFFAGNIEPGEKIRIASLLTKHLSAFWDALVPTPQPTAAAPTPSPDHDEEKA